MARQFTEEEVRERFLTKINSLIEYWNGESVDTKQKLEGLAFSILSTIDGSAADLPAFILAPCPSPEDKQYSIEKNENWFPENNVSKVECDIAGSLHDSLHNFKKKVNG